MSDLSFFKSTLVVWILEVEWAPRHTRVAGNQKLRNGENLSLGRSPDAFASPPRRRRRPPSQLLPLLEGWSKGGRLHYTLLSPPAHSAGRLRRHSQEHTQACQEGKQKPESQERSKRKKEMGGRFFGGFALDLVVLAAGPTSTHASSHPPSLARVITTLSARV